MKLQRKSLLTFMSSFFAFFLVFTFDDLLLDKKERIVAVRSVYASTQSVEEIVSGFKKRYDVSGFKADFYQTVTLNHMGTTDIAHGKLSVLKPNKIRWEYTIPYPQVTIYNNNSILIFNPEDEQVIVFGRKLLLEKGIDISLILDTGSIQDNFSIYLEKDLKDLYRLRLVQKETSIDLLPKVYIFISKINYDLLQVKVITSYGDETIIKLDKIDLKSVPSLDFFELDIPENVDILKLND